MPISQLKIDEPLIFTWHQRPILVMKRSAQIQKQLAASHPELLAHDLKAEKRSQRLDVFVAFATGTDFGCPIEHLPLSEELFLDKPWQGGFQDTCRHSRYDYAGRVYQNQNAKEDLKIPDYKITGEVIVLMGL